MKRFKKILLALALVFAGIFALSACTKVDLEAAKEALEIKYVQGETYVTVKSNLTLPTKVEGFEGVTVEWASDKPAVISATGVVVRQDADTVVNLTATLRAEGQEPVTKTFKVTVLAKEPPTYESVNVTFVVTAPEGTEEVFLIGNMIGAEWPIADAVALTKGNDGKFSVTKALAPGEYEYKYVCSKDWDYVEKTAENEDILNRVINVPNTAATATQEDVVAKWAKVPGEVVVDKTELKTLLDAHYVDTLAVLNFLVETDTVELVGTIGNHTVTWASNNAAVINPETGVVTRPAYTDGSEIFVVLTASAEGQNDVMYVVKVPQLPETLDQKLEKELTRLTNFPSSYKPILKVSINLAELKDVFVDGEVVTEATWESSDPTLLTHEGQLTGAGEGEQQVSLTVTFTYEGITKTKTVQFTVVAIPAHTDFLSVINGPQKAAKDDLVKVNGVSLYKETDDGYYLLDVSGNIMFVYGKTGMPAANKLFNIQFVYDIYYQSPQAKNVVYTEVEGAANTNVNVETITLADLVAKPRPTDDNPLVHKLYKVTGGKLHNYDESDNYGFFLVPQSRNTPTVKPTEADSMMLYYQTPGGLARLRALVPTVGEYSSNLEHIVIVVSAYRTNNNIYAFMFLGDTANEADLKLSLTPQEAAELALTQASSRIEKQLFLETDKYTLNATETVSGEDFAITYESLTPANVDNAGDIVLFPEVGTIVDVTFKLTTETKDATPVTVEKQVTVKLGIPTPTSIDAAAAAAVNVGDVVSFEGYYFGANGSTAQFVDGVSSLGAAVRSHSGLEVGKWYVLVVERAAVYNGLAQFNFKVALDSTKTEAPALPAAFANSLTNENLLAVQNGTIVLEKMKVVKVPTDNKGALEYTLENLAGERVNFREHKDSTAHQAAVLALNLQLDEWVNVTSAIVSWFNNPQLTLATLEKTTVTDQVIFEASIPRLEAKLPSAGTLYYESFTLPIKHEGAVVVWEVTAGVAATVDADGLVTLVKQDAEADVTLTGTVTKGELTPITVTVSIKVAAIGQEPPTETLLTTIDFGTVAKTGYSAGILKFTNGDGVEYSFNKDRAQTNTSDYAPHDTQGSILVLSCKSSAQFAFVEIDLTATAGLTKVSIDFSVWNQNYFDKITGLAGSAIQFEKLDGETWVPVAATTGETNLLSLLTVDVYTTVTFDNLTAGKYRITYSAPGNTSGSNTEYAVTADDIKIYGIQ
jgi:hypothetical protein